MSQFTIAEVLEDQKMLQEKYDQYLSAVNQIKDKYGDDFVRVTVDNLGYGRQKVNLNTRLR